MKILLFTIVTIILSSGVANADNNLLREKFKELDRNHDSLLTQQEIQAQPVLIRFTNFYPPGSFISADINKDGVINIEEFIANEESISAE